MARLLSPRCQAAWQAYVAYPAGAPAAAPVAAAAAAAVGPVITHEWIKNASVADLQTQIRTHGIDFSSSKKATISKLTKSEAQYCVTMHYYPGGPVVAGNTPVWTCTQYLLFFCILFLCGIFQFICFAALSEVFSAAKQESWFFDKADVTMPAWIMFCFTWGVFYFVCGDTSWEITTYRSLYCCADFSQFESLFDWRVLVTFPLLAITSRIITENHSFYKRIPIFVVKFVVKWIWATTIVSKNFVAEMVILGFVFSARPAMKWVTEHQKWFVALGKDFESTANYLISGKTTGPNLTRDEYKEYGAMLGMVGSSFTTGACTQEEKTNLEDARKKMCSFFIAIITFLQFVRKLVRL